MAAEVQRADSVYQTQLQASIDLQNFRTSLSGTFASQSDVTKAVSAEQGRADGAYETKVDAADAHRAEERRADAKYVAKVDVISSASGATDSGKVVKLNALGKIDSTMLDASLNPTLMYTTAQAAADKAANLAAAQLAATTAVNNAITTEIARADGKYVAKTDPISVTTGVTDADKVAKTAADGMLDDSFIHKIQASRGATDANKIVATDANGKIASSFLNLPGAMVYKGAIDPVTVPPTAGAKSGEFHVSTGAGVIVSGWPGLSGQTVRVGDGLLFDGTNWDLLAADADVNAVLTQLTAEVTRAQAAELKLTNDLAAAISDIQRHEIEVQQMHTDLTAEVARAQAAETKLTTDLAAEVTRADTAEKANAALIAALTTRLAAVEAKLAIVTVTGTEFKVAGTIAATGDITAFKP
jgi:hypothetical protein